MVPCLLENVDPRRSDGSVHGIRGCHEKDSVAYIAKITPDGPEPT